MPTIPFESELERLARTLTERFGVQVIEETFDHHLGTVQATDYGGFSKRVTA